MGAVCSMRSTFPFMLFHKRPPVQPEKRQKLPKFSRRFCLWTGRGTSSKAPNCSFKSFPLTDPSSSYWLKLKLHLKGFSQRDTSTQTGRPFVVLLGEVRLLNEASSSCCEEITPAFNKFLLVKPDGITRFLFYFIFLHWIELFKPLFEWEHSSPGMFCLWISLASSHLTVTDSSRKYVRKSDFLDPFEAIPQKEALHHLAAAQSVDFKEKWFKGWSESRRRPDGLDVKPSASP